MRKFISTLITLMVLSVAVLTQAALVKVNFLTTNDFHGHLSATKGEVGAARYAALLKELKKQYAQDILLYVGVGDLFSGGIESNLYKGLPSVQFFSDMELDVDVCGNHIFDFSKPIIAEQVKAAKFPILSANIKLSDGTDFFPAYTIVQRGDLKIGIVGISTGETFITATPKNLVGFKLIPPEEIAQRYIDEVRRKGADIVVLDCHIGSNMSKNGKKVEGEIMQLAQSVKGADAIFSGHSHELVSGELNGMPIVQANHHGKAIGLVQLTYDTERKKVVKHSAQYFDVAKCKTVDKEVAAKVASLEQKVQQAFSKVVGYNKYLLTNERHGQSTVAEVMTDLMRSAMGADVVILNGGGFRSDLKAGKFTVGDLRNVYPFDNAPCLVKMKGSAVRAAIEHSLTSRGHGMIRFSGLKVKGNEKDPVGRRIKSITLANGMPFDEAKEYLVGTNDFLAGGGDGFTMFKGTTVVKNWDDTVAMLIAEISKTGRIDHKQSDGRLAY